MGSLSDEVRTEVLCGRICYLEAENAKLRELVRKLDIDISKLRELLRDTLPFIDEESGFCVPSECFMYPACCDDTSYSECPVVARIHERARELGVEGTDG